jgi:hypothetical protein
MFTIKKFALSTAACGLALFTASAANAQATRTWVSGVGDDVNPCSRTAPCKTFAGAISKTAAGGEINCLDPGGYGAVTIVKSMTINCVYTEGGVLAGGNGIVVNAQPTDTVVLRGLDIFGVNPPTNGVRIVQAGSVTIEDSTIRRFNAANSAGISFAPSNAGARLFVNNVTITENGSGSTGGGIVIQPTGTGSAVVSLRDVRIRNNANNGIRVDATGNTGTRNTVMIDNVEIAGNGHGIAVTAQAGTTPTAVMVRDSTITGNGFGIIANGGFASVRVGNSGITGNTTGVTAVNSAAIFSYGDNLVDANPDSAAPNNGSFTGAAIPKR